MNDKLKKPSMRSKVVIHLARDEKFIDMAIRSFERNRCKNELYVYGDHVCKFIRSDIHGRISPFDSIFGRLAKKLEHADLVVIHSLNEQWVNVILKLPLNVPILWLGWGGDYYHYIYPSGEYLLLNKTKKIPSPKRISVKGVIKFILLKLFVHKNIYHAINRIDYFAPVLFNEYCMVKNTLKTNCFPKQVIWNYGNIEDDLLKGNLNESVNNNNILVGNSATATNNHIEAFNLLKKFDLKSRLIICPLSYGDELYLDAVSSKGKDSFNGNFEPLIEFIPVEEYIGKIKSCGFVLMNHVRQQAVGNIVIMLHLGAKVFLREENPVYSFLKEEGAVIYSIQELEENAYLLDARLTIDEVMINKGVVYKHWSKSSSDEKTKKMLDEIFL